MTVAQLATDLFTVSVQIACVIAVAGALGRVVRIDSAAVRYQYWRALLALCIVLPWIETRRAIPVGVDPRTFTFPATPLTFATTTGASAHATGISWVEVAIWLLLAGIVIRLARVGYGIICLRRLRRAGHLAPANNEHDEVQSALGTQADIRYVRHGQPVTCGFWRPVVLLPEHLTSHPSDIRRAVLAHELLHVKRRDSLAALFEELLRSVFWFHPAVWWLVGRVRLAREEVVDELTVCFTGRRRAYLEALLAFADGVPFATGSAFARRRHLFRRMTLISKEAVMSSRRIALSCVVLVLGVAAGSWYSLRAFPLVAQAQGAQSGSLEQNAKPVTPENPIPRRTYSVLPPYPAVAAPAYSAFVMLRVTVDALGRAAEVRPVALLTGVIVAKDAQILASGALTAGASQSSVFSSSLFVSSAVDAVRQWVYEPPADAPVSFDVAFLFAPGSETRLIAHGGSMIPAPEGASAGAGDAAPPPPPPPPPAPWVRAGAAVGNPVHVGGDVKPPVKVTDVRAVYPPDALAAHIQGNVTLEATIGTDGRVNELRVLNGIQMLDRAAMDAVKEWTFAPGTVNGLPVPVIVTIMVNFTLK